MGDSDGEPRQEINPWAQARDYRYALTWLAAQPGIDPERLGIWGSSFSGGEVLVVGAVDPRVKVVIANVPFAGLLEDPSAPLDERFAAMRAALEDESGAGPADTTEPPIGPLPVDHPDRSAIPSRAGVPAAAGVDAVVRGRRRPGFGVAEHVHAARDAQRAGVRARRRGALHRRPGRC